MPFDAKQFVEDHGIDYARRGRSKHFRKGWVNVACPFCSGHEGYHGGFHVEKSFYNCHRCGAHWMPRVVAGILSVPIQNSIEIISKYTTQGEISEYYSRYTPSDRADKEISLPPNISPLSRAHSFYLRNERGFVHYQKIIRDWKLKSLGAAGIYSHRIFIPIFFGHKIVSYQCRATLPSSIPYLACAEKDEIIHHKHIVYGFDQAIVKGKCVVVEGVTDVWRLGQGAVATFGKGFTWEQVKLLANSFPRIFKFFDSDANKEESLEWALALAGAEVEMIKLPHGDPGGLSDGEAATIMQDLGF